MPLPPNPTVTVYFYGIALLCFDDETLCQIGIQSSCDDHDLKISVASNNPTPVPASVSKYTLSHKSIRNSPAISLNVESPMPAKNVVERFCPKDSSGQCEPFDRTSGKGDPQDFRWVIDLESDVFDHQLEILPGVFTPSLFMNRGVFYTAVLTDTEFELRPQTKKSDPPKPLGRVARYVAANIYLEKGEGFVLKADDLELFRVRYDEDEDFETAYEIVVDNAESESYAEKVRGGILGFLHENHLEYYYDGIAMGASDEVFFIKPVLVHLGDRFPPCNAAWLSKTTSLP